MLLNNEKNQPGPGFLGYGVRSRVSPPLPSPLIITEKLRGGLFKKYVNMKKGKQKQNKTKQNKTILNLNNQTNIKTSRPSPLVLLPGRTSLHPTKGTKPFVVFDASPIFQVRMHGFLSLRFKGQTIFGNGFQIWYNTPFSNCLANDGRFKFVYV